MSFLNPSKASGKEKVINPKRGWARDCLSVLQEVVFSV